MGLYPHIQDKSFFLAVKSLKSCQIVRKLFPSRPKGQTGGFREGK